MTDAAEPERGSVVVTATCRNCEMLIARCARTDPWRHMLSGLVPCGFRWACCGTCWEIIIKTDVWRHRLNGETRCNL